MSKSNYFYYDTDLGRIGIVESEAAITHVLLEGEALLVEGNERETPLLKKAASQLMEYCSGSRMGFELPLSLKGTDFQCRVWKALQEIPYGETRSYRQIAEAVGIPKAYRAVGMANNRNPIAVIVPCHRVIGADGRLVGYGGGLPMKEKLLALESKFAGRGKR